MSDLHKQIKKATIVGQHVQRNWDLSKQVSDEDLELMIHSITQCPSKQNGAFYKVHVVKDRDIIEKIHNSSYGFRMFEPKEEIVTNPQVLANVLFVFEKTEPSSRIKDKNERDEQGKQETMERDGMIALGIASGFLNLTANMLGYRTGCCQCMSDRKAINEAVGATNDVVLMMGVGYPREDLSRLVHHADHDKKFYSIKKEPIEVIHH